MRIGWGKSFVVVALAAMAMARLVTAQVVGVQPQPLALYTYSTNQHQFVQATTSSPTAAVQNNPQPVALYGYNPQLGQWAPCTTLNSCGFTLSLQPMGAWSALVNYGNDAVVTYGTGPIAYISMVSGNLNHAPDISPTYWMVLASQGTSGTNCASGSTPGTCTFNGSLVATVNLTAPTVDVQGGVLVQEMANNSDLGATLNKLLCAGAISNNPVAQTCTTTSSNWTGITTGGATGATPGNTLFARGGNAQCVFDGQTVFGDYVQISSTVAGDCHDSGLTTYPVYGAVVGRVRGVNSGAGTMALVDVYSPGIVSNNAPLNAAFSNQGTALTAATACGPPQGLPRSGTISSVSITGSVLGGTGGTGSVTVDVLTETLANFRAGTAPTSITNGHPLVLTSSGGNTFTSGSFSLWSTTALTQANVVCFSISSVSTFTGLTIQVTY